MNAHHQFNYIELPATDLAAMKAFYGAAFILYSVDLEASVSAVTDAGGVVSVPIYGFPGGRRFHFIDPSGNELAIWSEVAQP